MVNKDLTLIIIPAVPVILVSSLTGGMSAELFQLYYITYRGLSPSVISTASLLMLASVPLQVYFPYIVGKFGYHRSASFGLILIQLALSLNILIAIFGDNSATTITIIVFLYFTAEAGISLTYGTCWGPIFAQASTTESRPVALGWQKSLSQATMLLSFLIINFQRDAELNSFLFVVINSIAMALAILASISIRKIIHSVDSIEDRDIAFKISDYIEVFRSKDRANFILTNCLMPFVAIPLLPVYFHNLDFSDRFILFIATIRVLSIILVSPINGNILQRIGNQSFLSKIFPVFLIIYSISILAPRGGNFYAATVWLIISISFFILKNALSISVSDIVMESVEEKVQLPFYNTLDIISSGAVQLNIIVSGILLSSTDTIFYESKLLLIDSQKIYFIVGLFALLYSMRYYIKFTKN